MTSSTSVNQDSVAMQLNGNGYRYEGGHQSPLLGLQFIHLAVLLFQLLLKLLNTLILSTFLL